MKPPNCHFCHHSFDEHKGSPSWPCAHAGCWCAGMTFTNGEKAGKPARCAICGRNADELCAGLACRACHVTITFEDCCAGATGL